MKEQIAELAAEGYPPTKLCTIFGLARARIEEILKEEDVIKLIEEFRQRTPVQVTNSKYDRIERKALTQLEENIPLCNTPELLKVLDTVNKKREVDKPNNPAAPVSKVTNIINIALPQRLVPTSEESVLTLNEQGEIIAVGERNFAALSAAGVSELFDKMRPEVKRQERFERKVEKMAKVMEEDL